MSNAGGTFENLSVGDLPTEVVDPDIDAMSFVPNGLGIPLHDLTLRPGTHRRVSFRGTPGTSVEVALRAHEWLPLDVLDAPRAGGGGAGFPAPDPQPPSLPSPPVLGATIVDPVAPVLRSTEVTRESPGLARSTSVAAGPTGVASAPIGGGDELLGTLRRAAIRPGLLGDLGAGRQVFDPFDPFPPTEPLPPFEPPPTPTLPVEVVVSARSGRELGRSTLIADPDSPSPARFDVSDIGGNEVIDVTFINPNEVPVICSSCTVRVDRRVRTTTTRIRNEMFLRAFNGAVRSLCPTITVADGEVRVSLKGDLAHALGLTSLTAEVPESFTGGATFEASDLTIMGQGDMLPQIVRLLQRLISRKVVHVGVDNGERAQLQERRRSHVAVAAFVDAVVQAYFDANTLVTEVVIEQVTPTRASKSLRDRLRNAVSAWLAAYPILIDPHRHRPFDPAMTASYALIGVHGEWGPIGLEVDEVKLSLFLAFNHQRVHLPAPHGDLPHDRLTIGTVRPALHVALDISDFDIDIDVPWWLALATAGTVSLGAFLLEQGLEELADFLAGKAEEQVPRAVHELVRAHQQEYGDVIAETLETIADRDRHFHRAAATRREFLIATIDDNQLRVPHDPSAGTQPSPVAGIGEQVPAVVPIDHDPSDAVTVPLGASPEELLNRIDHFVFVMMENRSFDHMLGHLSHPDFGRRSDVDGLDGSDRLLGGDLTGTRATPLPGPSPAFFPNLPHDHESIVRQINEGQMNGFASEFARKLDRTQGINARGLFNDPERALRFQTPDVVTTYDRLAREYTVCDRWFCSVPAGTYPNRACYYTGVTPSLTNDEIAGEFGYVSDLTLFDVLDHVGVDWMVYESDITFLRVYRNFRIDQDRIRPISELGDPLPTVTFIDPNFTGFPSAQPNNDDQPPTNVRAGQEFLAGIVHMVENSANWDSTMLVVTYDEHGGFADHVPPPGAPGSSHPPDGSIRISRAHPDAGTYGVRVPAFVVSPLARAGGVASQIFDHAAVFRTLLQRFAPQHVNSRIIPERVRRSRHLGEVLMDQPPRVMRSTAAPRQVMTAQGPRRSRITFREPEDREDLAWALNQIGMPRG